MIKKMVIWSSIIGVLIFTASAFGANSESLLGKWWSEKKDAHIDIYKCSDTYSGKIVYLTEPNFSQKDVPAMAGKPKVDLLNPDPAKQNIPIIGLNILSGFQYVGNSEWEGGIIYNPNDGKTYKCDLKLENTDRLKLRVYVGVAALGKTLYWTRVK